MTDGITATLGSLTLNGGTLASTAIHDTLYGSWYLNQGVSVGAGTSTISASKVSWAGARTFTVAGTLDVTGTFAWGSSSPSAGGLTKAGNGLMTMSGTNAYTGVTKISAGTLSVGSIGNGGVSGNFGAASNAAANLVFDGGTLQYTGATASTNRNFTINAGKTATFDITTNNLTVSGASIATNGALTKTGAGTLTLSGANLHSGNTTVRAGTLKLDISGSISSSANIIVGDTGSTGTHLDVTTKTGGLSIGLGVAQTLKGIGQIDGNTTIASLGVHAPGNSPGLQTFNGNLIYSTGSMLNWELATNKSTDTTGLRGTDFDGIDVIGTGVLSIATGMPGVTSNLVFNAPGSTVDFANSFWNSNHSWLVYDDVNAPSLASGAIFDTITVTTDSLGATISGNAFAWQQLGNDVYLNYTVPPIPEPATYGVLTALGLMGFGMVRRLRGRRAGV